MYSLGAKGDFLQRLMLAGYAFAAAGFDLLRSAQRCGQTHRQPLPEACAQRAEPAFSYPSFAPTATVLVHRLRETTVGHVPPTAAPGQ